MTRARDVASVLTAASTLSTDTETAAVANATVSSAMSAHHTAANGHVGRGTTANRPGSPSNGDLYFDTTVNTLIIYNGTSWISLIPLPNPPTSVSATQTNSTVASISFTPPTTGPTVNSYIVTSSPGNITASGSSSPISVTGLTNGTTYTFTVASVNDNGVGTSSSPSAPVTLGPPEVSGGSLTSDATYYYRTFTSSSSLTVSKGPVTMDILRIAGGGAGGGGASQYYAAGGGGAGGYVYTTGQSMSPTSYTVTVGGGGASDAASGTNSNITGGSLSLTAAVGGGGGGNSGGYGVAGGSSGGSTHGLVATQPSVSGQGNAGGPGNGYAGAGGGGAGGAGGTSNSPTGGLGGAGLNTWSSWATVTGTGVSGFYAGGGGGGHSTYYGTPSPLNNGGSGGGGRGASSAGASGTAGTANTGSGGGGGGANGSASVGNSANGGSGIVIVRYTRSQVGG